MQPDGLPLHSLALEPAIESHFLTVAPDTPLADVLALMSQFRSCLLPSGSLGRDAHTINSQGGTIHCFGEEWETAVDVANTTAGCVLVIEQSQAIAIFTERDIVRLTAAGISLHGVKIIDVATSPPVTLKQSQALDIFTALGLFRQHGIRHLPIVDDQGKPIGIVTHDSVRRALQPVNLLTRLRYVRDVMTTQVVHAPVTACVLELAKLMTEYQVSCVVITDKKELAAGEEDKGTSRRTDTGNGKRLAALDASLTPQLLIPVGIVTERDIVQFQALELDLSRMVALDVMSTPLFCLHPSDSLWLAHEEMRQRHVRRIVVAGDRGELVGIVSQTSLLQVLNPADMYGAIEILQQMVEERTTQLKRTNHQLRHEIAERQRAETALLEAHDRLKILVEERTAQLTKANMQLKRDILERQRVEAALRKSEAKLKKQATKLKNAIQELRSYQMQLIQTEKMSSLGQLVAGIAHEINNPINFIYGNIAYASEYVQDIMYLLDLYEQHHPQTVAEIEEEAKKVDLNFVKTDLPKLINSMKLGADRIRDLVLSLRNFSRLDEAEMKSVDLHEGIDSTLLILQNQLKAAPGRCEIAVIKHYGDLPLVECYPGQLNQVFMNLLTNAIDALEESRRLDLQQTHCKSPIIPVPLPAIAIYTGIEEVKAVEHSSSFSPPTPNAAIRIVDNGSGMTESVRRRLFDPFFTTKGVGKGTGLGLSISYQIIVEKHGGQISCTSTPGQGTEFAIKIPLRQQRSSTRFAMV
ncbi:MAG TPA: CBS domain-containing protein [Allocoleopsis sp.]